MAYPHEQLIFTDLFTSVDDCNQIVFVDALNGEESIEVVNNYGETEPNCETERTDILEAQELPKSTIGELYYSTQEGLDVNKNKVQSRPKIDEKIKGHMATLQEILQNPDFAPLHGIGKEVNDKLTEAIGHASKNSTSLSAVNDLLGSCFMVLMEACHGVADKFALSDDVVIALADFKRCERERIELQKKTEMESAEEKIEEQEKLLDAAITDGELDVKRVLGRQKMVEEARTLQKFVKKRDELDQDITTEIEELKMMSENCEGDKNTIGKSLETLRQSAEVAFKKYTQKDKSLCKELQENRAEQDKLQQRLNQLKQHEQKLEEDRKKRSEDQQTAEMTEKRARQELEKWCQQIQELQDRCQAALHVMKEFKDGSSKLLEASIESKRKEEKDLHELDIMAHRRLRDATAAAAVHCKQQIEYSENNLKYLANEIKVLKEEKKSLARSGLKFAVEVKEKLKKFEESSAQYKQTRATNQQRFELYKKKLEELDERLDQLGEIVEAFDDIYDRVQEAENALWDAEGFSSLED